MSGLGALNTYSSTESSSTLCISLSVCIILILTPCSLNASSPAYRGLRQTEGSQSDLG